MKLIKLFKEFFSHRKRLGVGQEVRPLPLMSREAAEVISFSNCQDEEYKKTIRDAAKLMVKDETK